MSVTILCDICRRSCENDRYLTGMDPEGKVFHICEGRDGMDVGCLGFYKGGVKHAKRAAYAWLEEKRPELIEVYRLSKP